MFTKDKEALRLKNIAKVREEGEALIKSTNQSSHRVINKIKTKSKEFKKQKSAITNSNSSVELQTNANYPKVSDFKILEENVFLAGTLDQHGPDMNLLQDDDVRKLERL